jgi:hypothetical protein
MMVVLTPHERLARALRDIGVSLLEEADNLPGSVLAYGRPHAHARSRFVARFTRSGVQLAGSVRIPPDCPRPVKGRCEC